MIEFTENSGTFTLTQNYTFIKEEQPNHNHNNISLINNGGDSNSSNKTNNSVGKYLIKIKEVNNNCSNNNPSQQKSNKKESYAKKSFRSIQKLLADIFLPYNYPASVSSDYLAYQVWDSLQSIFSSIGKVFAVEALYKALGVGDANSTALTAATVILLQDASFWIGQIIFSWAKGRAFDYDNKKWRYFADVGHDAITGFRLTFPYYPSAYLLYIICGTSFMTACQGTAGFATRVGLVVHQSRSNNSSDVKAKDLNQERLINLIGLGIALGVLYGFKDNFILVWIIFTACSLLHVISNYFALKTLRYESFNRARLLHCVKYYLKHGKAPTIKYINRKECLVLGFGIKDTDICQFQVKIGVKLSQALKFIKTKHGRCKTKIDMNQLIAQFPGKLFLILVNSKKEQIIVILHQQAKAIDMIEAYVRSLLIGYYYSKNKVLYDPMDPEITNEWNSFANHVTVAGFDLNQDQLGCDDWRVNWEIPSLK